MTANRTNLEWRIREVLRNFKVRSHYRASFDASKVSGRVTTRYAVFSEGKQASASMSHAEAKAACEDMIVADLIELMEAHAHG